MFSFSSAIEEDQAAVRTGLLQQALMVAFMKRLYTDKFSNIYGA